MQLEAIYDNGKLIFDGNFDFVHDRFRVKIELPDAEVVGKLKSIETTLPHSNLQTLKSDLRAIYKTAISDADSVDDQLTEKQHSRWGSALLQSTSINEGTL